MAEPAPALIYLDHQATTPCDPAVVAAMLPLFGDGFGNPHSASHRRGRNAAALTEAAREQIATLLGAAAEEIVFTSGATEANNLGIKGAARFLRDQPRKGETPRRRILTFASEHKCVLESVNALTREGFTAQVLPVLADGQPDLAALDAALGSDVALVSCMAANNEVGTIAPLGEIGAMTRAAGALLHTDAAQAAGKIPLDLPALGVDLASLSAHKLYGPMGIGALYVRRRPRVRLSPLFDGGAQERGVRSGTLPLPLCVGFGRAAEIARSCLGEESVRLAGLRDRLQDLLMAGWPGATVNGSQGSRRLPHNLNIALPGVDAQALMAALPGLCVSTGSACTSASVETSYVLRAMGVPGDLARSSLRFGIGRFTTLSEIERAAAMVLAAAAELAPKRAA